MRLFKNLVESRKKITPDEAFAWLKLNRETAHFQDVEKYERVVAKDSDQAYKYAIYLLDTFYIIAPDVILKRIAVLPWDACDYAINLIDKTKHVPSIILKGMTENNYWVSKFVKHYANHQNAKWMLAVITTNLTIARAYAEELIISGKDVHEELLAYFEKGSERSHVFAEVLITNGKEVPEMFVKRIAKHLYHSSEYAKFLVNNKQEVPEVILRRIAKDPQHAFWHAKHLVNIKNKVPEVILNSVASIPATACNYAVEVIKDRFPAGEEAIIKDQYYLERYIRAILIELKKPPGTKFERDVILLNDELTHYYIMTVYKDVYPRRADLMKNDLGITDPVHRYIAAYISNLPIRGGITGDPEIEALYKQEIL